MYESTKVAEIIKATSKTKGIQLKNMLVDLELNKNTLSNMYNGSMLKADSLARIADYLDCSVDYLLGRHSPSETKKDDSTEALPSADKLTPSQQKLVEYASDLTNEELQETLDFIGYLKAKRSN